MTIDAIIAGAIAPVEAQSNETISKIEGETESTETTESTKPEVSKEDEERAKDRKLSKQDRRIGRMTAEKYAMRKELEELREKLKITSAPKEADFEGKPYGDYLDARAENAADKRFNENKAKDIESRLSADEAAYKEERGRVIAENAIEARKSFSDFDDVLKASKPTLDSLPAEIQELFLEADNGAYALFALAKEGSLRDLGDMTPARAAMIIAKMEDKGLQLSKLKEASKAPPPIETVKGTGASSKDPTKMTDAEFNAWRRASIAKKR